MPFDPFSAGLGIAGLGLDLYGGFSAISDEKQIAKIQQQEVGVELQQDQVRRQAMEMSAQRQMLQQVRGNQMARSQALATAGAQGAQFGSGLQGAYGSIGGQTATNISGISQGLQFGESMFNLNAQLDQLKIQQAGAESNLATSQGIMSMAGGLMNVAKLV